jgi:hypothetical protein
LYACKVDSGLSVAELYHHHHHDLESIVNEEETTEVSSVYVCSIEMSAPGAYKQGSAKLDNVPIRLVNDLGAKVSIISHSFYCANLSHRVLKVKTSAVFPESLRWQAY